MLALLSPGTEGHKWRLCRIESRNWWKTLVFLKDGKEVAQLVRPGDAKSISEALARIDR